VVAAGAFSSWAGEIGLDGGDQELEVLYLVAQVRKLRVDFLLVQLPSSVEPHVEILFGLLRG
jgi:hypothetical protein